MNGNKKIKNRINYFTKLYKNLTYQNFMRSIKK